MFSPRYFNAYLRVGNVRLEKLAVFVYCPAYDNKLHSIRIIFFYKKKEVGGGAVLFAAKQYTKKHVKVYLKHLCSLANR